MARIMVRCPTTKKPVYTGMSADEGSFKTSTFSGNSFRCPECKQNHTWDKKDAWLEKAQ